jgi:hypothetical protein
MSVAIIESEAMAWLQYSHKGRGRQEGILGLHRDSFVYSTPSALPPLVEDKPD